MKEQEEVTTYVIREIPVSLWKAFKVKCAKNEVSMREKITELIKEYAEGK